MEEERRFGLLVERARLERPPRVNVAGQVVVAIRRRSLEQATGTDPWAWVAAPAVALAVSALLFVFTGQHTWSDLLAATGGTLPWWML